MDDRINLLVESQLAPGRTLSDDPAFTFVEFNQIDSAHKGCVVCSLDMTSEPHRWEEALRLYGVMPGEMERYASALLTDAEQLAAQGDRSACIPDGDPPQQSYALTEQVLRMLTLEEVNDAASRLCAHITELQDGEMGSEGTIVVVACAPKSNDGDLDEYRLRDAIREACSLDVAPEEDLVVPYTLVTEEELDDAAREYPSRWESARFPDGTPNMPADRVMRPFTLLQLGNSMRVGVTQNLAESQRGHLRLVAPGGRDAEEQYGFRPGSLAMGARAVQEGGSFGKFTWEQVELFAYARILCAHSETSSGLARAADSMMSVSSEDLLWPEDPVALCSPVVGKGRLGPTTLLRMALVETVEAPTRMPVQGGAATPSRGGREGIVGTGGKWGRPVAVLASFGFEFSEEADT
ncbi:hypothetical protein ACHAW5_008951 [Stephanodiscus triporus]|uniref:Uncharacterized protein n=1 Tax=Stephanodiscus triporus TaxID=2934178 RepID=A0ABD3NPH3_9STRA